MLIIPRSDLIIGPRQRTEKLNAAKILDYKQSILRNGLLHPLVAGPLDGKWSLIAGECRLSALDSLAGDGKTVRCGGEELHPGFIPITPSDASDELSRFEAELDENLIRSDLSWANRTKALAQLHRLRASQNPTQTLMATAVEVAAKSGGAARTERRSIAIAQVIEPHLSNPKIASARNEVEAYQLVLAQEQAIYEAELIRRKKRDTTSRLTLTVKCGDSLQLMQTMDEAQFDLILTDPPYGVKAGGQGYRSRSAHHHNYEDTPENARTILRAILTDGWRLCKPRANLFIFTDIRHFEWLGTYSAQMGWTPWRYPVIWQKSLSEGLVPWGRHGFAHTFDIIFFATKGQRGLVSRHIDILSYPRVSRSNRIYAAEKPIPLLSKLIDLSTLPGDTVFDPCLGSGSTLVAAKALSRHGLGIELDSDVADLATVRVERGDAAADFSVLDRFEEQEEEELDTVTAL